MIVVGMNRTLMRQNDDQIDDLIYTESISSNKTEALFLALLVLFFLLLIWRVNTGSLDILSIVFTCFFIFFLFYSVNYRTLVIQLTLKYLKLRFGIFTWVVPLDNIESCGIDEIPMLMKVGGAGIHFMLIRSRYRASFNFLEYSRVVVAFRKKAGPIRDISFSTPQPNEILRHIEGAMCANRAVQQSRSPIPDS